MTIVKDLAPDVPVIARVNRAENVERIYAAGADFSLSISQVSGQLLAWRLLGKESIEVDAELWVIKVSTRGLENLHPQQNDLRERTGCTIVALERGEELLVEFSADFKFTAGDAVYVCGSAEATQKFYQYSRRNRTRRIGRKARKVRKKGNCNCQQPPVVVASLTLGQQDRLELGFERGGHGHSFSEHLLQIAAGDRTYGHAGFLGFGDELRIF